MDDEIETVLGWWQDWKHLGLLPWDGEMRDQPAQVVEALGIAAAEWRDAEKRHGAAGEAQTMNALRTMFGGKGG